MKLSSTQLKMDDDSELVARDMELDEAAKELVKGLDFHTGMLVMPEEFGDYTMANTGERTSTLDCMVVTITTVDHEEHLFTLLKQDVLELSQHFIAWINDLHEAGRCDCGEHDTT